MKSMFKRCTAAFLALALVITTICVDANETNAAETNDVVKITDVELVAKNYGQEGCNILTKEESTILESGALKDVVYQAKKPTSENAKVDSDNLIIYANNIEKDNYKWVAESADILIEGAEPITVPFKKAEEGSGYDVSAKYNPGESKDYTVSINYALYITVGEAEQAEILNAPSVLSKAVLSMEGVVEASYTMDEIIKQVASNNNIQQYKEYFSDDLKAVITKWTNQYNNYEYSTLTMELIDKNNGFDEADNKFENMKNRGKQYRSVALDIYNEVGIILKYKNTLSTIVTKRNWDQIEKNLVEIQEELSVSIDNEWAICNKEYMLKDNVNTNNFYELLSSMEYIEPNDVSVITTTELLATTTSVQCNVNRKAVTIQIEATAYNENGVKVPLNKVCDITLNLGEGTSLENVEKAVEETGFEAAMLDAWSEYEIGTTHYNRSVNPGFSGTLKEDVVYTISYNPKQYTVSFKEDGEYTIEDQKVYFGEVIKLPEEITGKWYTYSTKGNTYEQGVNYRVLCDVTFEVVRGNAKEEVRVYDLIAGFYGNVSEEAKEILTNKAINDQYIYIRKMDKNLVKYIEGDTEDYISTPNMSASENMAWVPVKVEIINGTDVVQTITSFTEGKAYIDSALNNEYTDIKVEYELNVTDVKEEDVKEALSLPNKLGKEAKSQLADLNVLASKEYKDNLGQITKAILNQLLDNNDPEMPQLTKESLAAVQNIVDNCMDGNRLKLLAFVEQYEGLTEEGRLEYYYNNKYIEIKEQANILAENFEILLEDENLDDLLTYFGQGSKVAMLEEASSKIGNLTSKFIPKNEAINTTANYTEYSNLVAAIVKSIDKTEDYSNQYAGLKITDVANPTVPNRSAVTVTVEVLSSTGAVKEVYTDGFTFNKETGLTENDIKNIQDITKALESQIKVDKDLYVTNADDVKLPEVGSKEGVKLQYTWSPKTYTVEVEGMEEQIISADNASIILPTSGNANVDYVYTIVRRTIRVFGKDGNVTTTLTPEEIKIIFKYANHFTVPRTVIDVKAEENVKFFAELNKAIVGAGAQDAASFVPFEDKDGNVSVVLKINPFSKNISAALMQIVQTSAMKASYVAIGDEAFVDGDIYMNAMVQAVLNNNNEEGFGTKTVDAIINTNGDIVENAKDKVKNQNVLKDAVSGVDTNLLGGLLVETTMAVETAANNMPLYITLEDYDKNANELAKVKKALAKVAPHAEVVCEDGKVEVKVNVPEKAYDYYIAAMLVEGKVDLHNFEEPTLAEMVAYAKELENEVVLGKESTVTGQTVANTVSMAGYSASEYVADINKALSAARTFLNTDGYFVENEASANDQYAFTVAVPAIKIVDTMGIELEGGLRNKVAGDVVVPAEIIAPVCNTEYEALVVTKTDSKLDVYDLTKDLKTTLAGVKAVKPSKTGNAVKDLAKELIATTYVILLDDVDSITTKTSTIIDLNGHTINELNAKEATFVIDSNLVTKGFINAESGNVVRSGAEEFYSMERDKEGNYTVSIAADILETDKMPAVKELAMELIGVIVLNEFTSAGLTIDGNEIYDIEVNDVIEAYQNGVKNTISSLVECFNEDGTEIFANTLIKTLTDFAAIEEALLTEEGIVAEYTLTTAPWDVALAKADDYLTGSVTSGVKEEKKLTIKFVGDKQELADLAGELADIVTEKDIVVELGEIAYDPANGFTAAGAGADVNITIDFTKSERDYLTVVAVILANGMNNPDQMVEAINYYLETGATKEVVKQIEKIPTSQIIKSLTKAKNVTFAEMVTKLGIDVESTKDVIALGNVYQDVLNLGSTIITKLGLEGGNQKLGSIKTDEYATYAISKENWNRMNISLKLVLTEEVKEKVFPDAVISVPTINKESIYGAEVDAENKIIFIDANWEGITGKEFKEMINFEFENVQNIVTDTVWNFTNGDDLVRTGDILTVKAWNAEQTNPVEISVSYKLIVVGDTNKDGKSTVSDASQISTTIVGLGELDKDASLAANVNKSTEYILTVADVALIQQKYTHENDYESFFVED